MQEKYALVSKTPACPHTVDLIVAKQIPLAFEIQQKA